jgi:hypothetical protein
MATLALPIMIKTMVHVEIMTLFCSKPVNNAVLASLMFQELSLRTPTFNNQLRNVLGRNYSNKPINITALQR